MSSLHPKFSVSVYQPGIKFNPEPFETTRGFAIHTLEYTDPPQNLATMYQTPKYHEKLKESTARKFYQTQLSLKLANANAEAMAKTQSFFNQSAVTSPDSKLNTESKLKSRLQKDFELANNLYSEEEQQSPAQQEEKEVQEESATTRVQPNSADVIEYMRPSVTARKEGNSSLMSPKNRFLQTFTPTSSMKKSSRFGTSPDFLKIRSKSSALKKTLYYDPRINSMPKTSVRNPVIEDLVNEEDVIINNPVLLESVVKLRDMQLLKQKQPGFNKFKGVGKIDYVYNDFHSRSTNPGYSRNTGGVFYFR